MAAQEIEAQLDKDADFEERRVGRARLQPAQPPPPAKGAASAELETLSAQLAKAEKARHEVRRRASVCGRTPSGRTRSGSTASRMSSTRTVSS